MQYEDEIIHRLVALEEVVLWWSLVFLIKLEFLHHAWVLYQSQEDLLWEMRRLKRLYFYRQKGDGENKKHINNIDNDTASWSFIIWRWFAMLHQVSRYIRLSNECEHIILVLNCTCFKPKTIISFLNLQILLFQNCLNWSLTGLIYVFWDSLTIVNWDYLLLESDVLQAEAVVKLWPSFHSLTV